MSPAAAVIAMITALVTGNRTSIGVERRKDLPPFSSRAPCHEWPRFAVELVFWKTREQNWCSRLGEIWTLPRPQAHQVGEVDFQRKTLPETKGRQPRKASCQLCRAELN